MAFWFSFCLNKVTFCRRGFRFVKFYFTLESSASSSVSINIIVPRHWRSGPAATQRGLQIVQTQKEKKKPKEAPGKEVLSFQKEYFMLFYRGCAPHVAHFLICKKRNGDLMNNWRLLQKKWIFFPVCVCKENKGGRRNHSALLRRLGGTISHLPTSKLQYLGVFSIVKEKKNPNEVFPAATMFI